ncbi:MAG: amino acid permease [Firmicutes bacterium]|nr:amino acid permease [Bacillota bacterium]
MGLCYAELSSRLPRVGGGYAFVREAFGPTVGFFMGWAYWGGYLIASGYVTLGFGGYLEQLSGLPRGPAAVGLGIVLALLNLRGVRVSSRFQTLLVAFEVTALFVIAGVGSMHARPALLTPFMP